MRPQDCRVDTLVDLDFSLSLSAAPMLKTDDRQLIKLPTNLRRRMRRKFFIHQWIGSSSRTVIRIRPLILVTILAALSNSNGGFAPACNAFVIPSSISKGSVRSNSSRGLIDGNRKDQCKAPVSRSMKTNTSVMTALSSTNPKSRTDTTTNDDGSDNNNNISEKNQNNAEVAGFVLAVGIILSLAGMSGPTAGLGNNDEITSSSVAVMTKVVENTVPTTSTEVVAVTLGESIGGVIGAIFSVAINFILRGGNNKAHDDSSQSENSKRRTSGSMKSLLSQGISDSDYFIANSASNTILEAAGVPETVAKYGSVFIAAIPSQLIKIVPRISEQKRAKQKKLLMSIERNTQQRKRVRNSISSLWRNNEQMSTKMAKLNDFVPVAGSTATAGGAASTSTTALTTESTAAVAVSSIDLVEVFADVTRWLEYE